MPASLLHVPKVYWVQALLLTEDFGFWLSRASGSPAEERLAGCWVQELCGVAASLTVNPVLCVYGLFVLCFVVTHVWGVNVVASLIIAEFITWPFRNTQNCCMYM